MRKRVLVTTLLALLPLAAACGGGGSSPNSGAQGSATRASSGSNAVLPTGPGSCEVNVSGDLTVNFKGKGGPSAVGSDYWMTDSEMRTAVAMVTGIGSNLSNAEKQKAVDDAMNKDPRLYVLLLNCISGTGDSKDSLSFMPSSASKYGDIPFKPGQYPIPTGGLLGGAEKPGEFSVLLSLGSDAYQVSQAGQINITKFDKTGISGTFNFGAEQGFAAQGSQPKKITVQGKFDFPCSGGGNCSK